MPKYRDDPLRDYELKSFDGGYNSFTASKLLVDDDEVPYGENVIFDDNGAATKRAGSRRYGNEVASGKAILGINRLKNTTYNKLIVAAGTAWYGKSGDTYTALTGVTFTDNKKTRFVQAFDKLYGANNTDALAYTSNGTSITSISSNGNIGDWPVFYNQRLYMTNATYKDRIIYSNPYALDPATNPPTLTGFSDAAMFNTDLTASPKKNAGYIVLLPGGGVEITRLFVDTDGGTDYLYAYTKAHGIWRILPVADALADGSIAHTVSRITSSYHTPSGESVLKVGNDQWFAGYDNIYSLGEVAQFQNIRVSTKSGRIKSEISSIATSGKSKIAAGFYKDTAYFAYQTGTYNDRMVIYDTILNAWSTPIKGISVAQFYEYEDDDGVRHFLAGSDNSADSYIYELESGTDDAGTAISAVFETKSTDCGKQGLIKRFAFIDVFYSLVYGQLSYEVFIDETSSITGSQVLGNSSSRPVGVGSMMVGSFLVGAEYDAATTFADLRQNDSFRIDCEFNPGKKISVRFTNNNLGEQFKINGIKAYFVEGSQYET